MNLPIATYQVVYNGKNITADVTNMVMSLTYTDKVEGGSDELEIHMEDSLEQWINNWYPTKGDTVQVTIFSGGKQLDCGTFTVDETEAGEDTGSGNTFTLKGIAAGINKQLRTKRSYAHSNKTLKEIANTVAANLGLTVMGSVQDITIGYVTQYRETDLQFLNRIGNAYGYIFSVRGNNLVFLYYKDVESRAPSLTFNKADRIKCTYKDTTNKVYKSASLKHHNSKTKQTLSWQGDDDGIDDSDTEDENYDESGFDDLNMNEDVENEQQAEAKGKHALHKHNTKGVTCEIDIPGNVLFVSGNNIQINEAGHFNGKYQITEASHKVTANGAYETSGSCKRLGK